MVLWSYRYKRSLRAEQNAICYPMSKRDRRRNSLLEKKLLQLELTGVALKQLLLLLILVHIYYDLQNTSCDNPIQHCGRVNLFDRHAISEYKFRSASLFNLRHPEHNIFVNSCRHYNNGLF